MNKSLVAVTNLKIKEREIRAILGLVPGNAREGRVGFRSNCSASAIKWVKSTVSAFCFTTKDLSTSFEKHFNRSKKDRKENFIEAS